MGLYNKETENKRNQRRDKKVNTADSAPDPLHLHYHAILIYLAFVFFKYAIFYLFYLKIQHHGALYTHQHTNR